MNEIKGILMRLIIFAVLKASGPLAQLVRAVDS